MDEPVATCTLLALFDQIWQDAEKLTDVTELIRDHIASVYKEKAKQLPTDTAEHANTLGANVSAAIAPSTLNTFVSKSAARSISGRTISPSTLLAGSATCFEICVIAAAFLRHELQRLLELTAATCPRRNVVVHFCP
jgi:hypothetical protein